MDKISIINNQIYFVGGCSIIEIATHLTKNPVIYYLSGEFASSILPQLNKSIILNQINLCLQQYPGYIQKNLF